jgi:DNA-binding winged helix-turn-helix (wHTH) protein
MDSDVAVYSYLIDNIIIFTPSEELIFHRGTMSSKKLKPAEVRILLLLVEKKGVVLSQNELLEFAWGDKHREISFNVFYQCILSLRKSIMQVGYSEKLITTIPRKGVMIDSAISIDEFREVIPDKTINLNNNNTSSRTALSVKEPIKHLFFNVNKYLYFVAVLIFSIVGVVIYYLPAKNDYFNNYLSFGTASGDCSLYFNPEVHEHSVQSLFYKLHPELCQKNKFTYITLYSHTRVVSALVCDFQMENKGHNKCQSFYYPEYYKK